MADTQPLFTAVSSSARQLLLLLRCISFAKKTQVHISPTGLRFTTDQGSVMEAFVVLDKSLFSSYTYNAPEQSSQDDAPALPVFQISLASLLETLNIFSLSDPTMNKRPNGDTTDAFAAHRLNRHAFDPFSARVLGTTGICTLTYDGPGGALRIHMAESGVTTTCDLTTYDAESPDEIPFRRDALALKTIMRSSYLLDAVSELSSLTPTELVISAAPPNRSGSSNQALALSASGALGSASVAFSAPTAISNPETDMPVLETFQCPAATRIRFAFPALQAAQRAMATATKVSMRVDEAGVLSLQFLVEVEKTLTGAMGDGGEDSVAFVDFRIVSLVEEGENGHGSGDGSGSETDDSDGRSL